MRGMSASADRRRPRRGAALAPLGSLLVLFLPGFFHPLAHASPSTSSVRLSPRFSLPLSLSLCISIYLSISGLARCPRTPIGPAKNITRTTP